MPNPKPGFFMCEAAEFNGSSCQQQCSRCKPQRKKIPRDKVVRRTALLGEVIDANGGRGRGFKWVEVKTFVGLPAGTSICTHVVRVSGYESHVYDVYRPKRLRDESPVSYYRKHKVVPDDFAKRHNGWYYCNPYHCSHRWRSRKARDAHMAAAYAILD